ncbi:MAG: hypothetical protein ACI93T_004641, partial [Porticoccaceae bacterium]
MADRGLNDNQLNAERQPCITLSSVARRTLP